MVFRFLRSRAWTRGTPSSGKVLADERVREINTHTPIGAGSRAVPFWDIPEEELMPQVSSLKPRAESLPTGTSRLGSNQRMGIASPVLHTEPDPQRALPNFGWVSTMSTSVRGVLVRFKDPADGILQLRCDGYR